MAILSRTLTMKGKGRRLVGKSTEGGGAVNVTLTRNAAGYRLNASGKGLDLSALSPDAGDPNSRDLTVAVEISGTSFVKNRNLAGKKNVFKIAKGSK
jgi:hypothetical protein